MSNRGEMWVHGSSVIVQYPGGEGVSPFTPSHRMLNAPDAAVPSRTVPWSDLLGTPIAVWCNLPWSMGNAGQ